jgi:alpha-glucosidase
MTAVAETHAAPPPAAARPWWRSAAIYQVYIRSFADGNGDGVGDIAGVRARLRYLRDLGVDAVWFNPWYPSPMADGGYDVADYRSIDPVFGTLAEAEQVIAEAGALGIRVIIDVVPNHVSDRHAWFRQALAAEAGSPVRDRFWFRPGQGADGELPPNNWRSIFGGRAWTRTANGDGSPGEWYLHLFAPEQPDLNWSNPEVRSEHESVLRFWFDRGAAGVRIDSAALLFKDELLPDLDGDDPSPREYVDRDELHEVYRDWRAIADSYPGERILIGELWLPDTARFARYLRPDELHTAFNFDFLSCPWDAEPLRRVIEGTLAAHAPVGAPATWVLSNHDVTRHVTRYGRDGDTGFAFAAKTRPIPPVDLALGTRRARAAALLAMALPGAVYVYQGEELGLPEVEDLPDDVLEDPMFFRSGGSDPGRDGCRVPLPWDGSEPPYGFSLNGSSSPPWLPQPAGWGVYSASAQRGDPGSMLELYRAALRIRRTEPELGDGLLEWLPAPDRVLAFARGETFACVVNLSSGAVDLPCHEAILLATGAVADGRIEPDTAVWLRTA